MRTAIDGLEKKLAGWLFLLAVVCLTVGPHFCSCQAVNGTVEDLAHFFFKVDRDGDGQIGAAEATKFMETVGDVEAATEQQKEAVLPEYELRKRDFNFSYGGNTISAEELTDHLQNLLTTAHVVDWLIHGLQLPQYADAFYSNSIDGLDLPSLLANNSYALEELGVTKSVHRAKISKAVIRLIFGMGLPPGPPQKLECQPSPCGSKHSAVLLRWQAPSRPGHPPVHKFLVQRRSLQAAAWQVVGDVRAGEEAALDVRHLDPSMRYMYRMQAWGGHGPSPWVTVGDCRVPTAREVQASCPFPAPPEIVLPSFLAPPGSSANALDSLASGRGGSSGRAWLYSINGGAILLLGVLSRFSIFFRTLVALSRAASFYLQRQVAAATESNTWALRVVARALHRLAAAWAMVQRWAWEWSLSARSPTALRGSPRLRGLLLGSPPRASMERGSSAPDLQRGLSTASGGGLLHVESDREGDGSSSQSGRQLAPGLRMRSASADMLASPDGTQPRGLGLGLGLRGGPPSSGVESEGEVDGAPGQQSARSEATSMRRRGKGGQRSKYRCNAPGCRERCDRLLSAADWAMRLSRHFCHECQGVYCLRHTRISPHGPLGQCGLDSRCVCEGCFAALPAEAQAVLERSNKLRVGPPVPTAAVSPPGPPLSPQVPPPASLKRSQWSFGRLVATAMDPNALAALPLSPDGPPAGNGRHASFRLGGGARRSTVPAEGARGAAGVVSPVRASSMPEGEAAEGETAPPVPRSLSMRWKEESRRTKAMGRSSSWLLR